MSQISLGEKLEVIWKMMSSSYIYFILLAFFLFLAYFFATTNRSNQKQSKRAYLLIYLIAFVVIFIQYGSGLYAFFDYFMNHLAVLFYFPNIAVYVITILITNVLLWISLFYSHPDKNLKRVNSIVFCCIHYLLILVLGIVGQQKLDVFTLESLYSSKEAMSLIEFSNFIFVIWILFLLLHQAIQAYQVKKGIIQVQSLGGYEVKSQFDLKKAYFKESRIIDFHEGYQATRQIEPPRLEVAKQVIPQEVFSLEDYKVLLELLQEYKEDKQRKKKAALASVGELASLYETSSSTSSSEENSCIEK